MKKIIIVCSLLLAVLLCSCGKQAAAKAGQEITVNCTDAQGNPVSGVKLLLCTDSTCLEQTTGDDGKAVFADVSGDFTVKLNRVPEGYENPEQTEIASAEGQKEYVFTLKTEGDDASQEAAASQQGGAETAQYNSFGDIDFSDYKLVMVNYWEPWCGFCVEEMPDLEALYQKYKDDGFLIIGMYSDEEDAQKTIEETGVTYPIIKYDGGNAYVELGYPTTVFFDSNGEELAPTDEESTRDPESCYGLTFVGSASKEEWENRILSRLNK